MTAINHVATETKNSSSLCLNLLSGNESIILKDLADTKRLLPNTLIAYIIFTFSNLK